MDMNEQFLRRGTKNEKKNCQSKLRHFEYDTQTFNNFWIMFEMHSRDIVQKNQFYITQPNSLSWSFTVRLLYIIVGWFYLTINVQPFLITIHNFSSV